MDPDANLAEQLKLSRLITLGEAIASDIERLAELIETLDEWLRNGGFLPRAWTK